MLAIRDWPEFKMLRHFLIINEIKFELTFDHIPQHLLDQQPSQESWFSNPSGLFNAELNALHQKVWQQGYKLRLYAEGTKNCITPEGGSPIKIQWPLGA